jgi:uncharacterized protein (DUF1697 family)
MEIWCILLLIKIISCDIGNDEIHIENLDIYVLYHDDIRKTQLTTNFLEIKLKVPLTVRNWNTVNKLVGFKHSAPARKM